MLRWTVALVVIALVGAFPTRARAGVTGDWGAYAVIARSFRVPLPNAYIHGTVCPDGGESETCANPSTGDAWIPAYNLDRFTLAHELGHVFDGQFLTDRDREWLRLVMRAPAGDWWRPDGAGEWFADYYGDCAVAGGLPRRDSEEGYLSSRPPARRVARVCWAITAWGLTR